MAYSFVVGANFITIILDGVPYMIQRSTDTGDRVIELIKKGASDEELLEVILDKKLRMYAETLCAFSVFSYGEKCNINRVPTDSISLSHPD